MQILQRRIVHISRVIPRTDLFAPANSIVYTGKIRKGFVNHRGTSAVHNPWRTGWRTVFAPQSQRLRFHPILRVDAKGHGFEEVAGLMADMDDFATSERPEWLKALARRSAAAADDGAEAPGGAPDPSHPHRAPRVRTLIRAVIGGDGRAGEDVIVRNVSPGGMCIASRTLLPCKGEMLRVSLPGQSELQAQVRWVGKGEFGVLLTGGSGLDVDRITASNRQRNAGFAAALEKLLGIRPQEPRSSAGMRAC